MPEPDPEPPLRIGRVALTAHDLDRVARFYREVVGLAVIAAGADGMELGAGGTVLLELRLDPEARRWSPGEAGLYHTAFRLPSRADLGRWMRHAAERGVELQGAADHLVSEAIYLADPEGNGVEVYADRRREDWTWVDGAVRMSNAPLDAPGLLDAAGATRWQGAPAGSDVGHVHLQVGALPAAEAFYSGLLGLAVTYRLPGAGFYSTGGYHHHIAANVWHSRGAPVRPERTTGLAGFEMIAADAAVLDALGTRVPDARRTAAGLTMRDPWGTSVTVTPSRGCAERAVIATE